MNMANTPTYIYKELQRRGVPVEIVQESAALMRYKHGGKWHLLKGCLTESAGYVACSICDKKTQTEIFAREAGLKVPKSVRYDNEDQAMEFIKDCGGPIVVKPLDAAHGHGISTKVSSKTGLRKAIRSAKKYSKLRPLLQEMVKGDDLRILVIGGKFTAAVRRVPATVVGDGEHTVATLIEIENEKGHRSKGKRGRLKVISLKNAKSFMNRRIGYVPKKGEIVPVVGVSNTSMGGHAEDATADVTKEIRKKAEAFAKLLSLPVCGIDIMLEENGDYHFIEANARPGFGPHHHPRVGKARNVTKVFVDYLLKDT